MFSFRKGLGSTRITSAYGEMRVKRNMVVGVFLLLAVGAGWMVWGSRSGKTQGLFKEHKPFHGNVESAITAAGSVLPQNRLEIKPPIAGRIDKIIVEEGQRVRSGDILALMSSTDRATLMDAARLQGGDALKKWEDVYKPTPLIAPADGEVIVRAVDPGQVVAPSDPVVVLSDRLIVQALLDETDIGKVRLGQEAGITLDAYPQLVVGGRVDHIYYESRVVNNVTIYQVDILPEQVPDVFRSGMSADVRIIREKKDNALLVASQLIKQKDGRSYVLLSAGSGQRPLWHEISAGISDGINTEVLAGLTLRDTIVEPLVRSGGVKKASGTNPFMPARPAGGGRGGR